MEQGAQAGIPDGRGAGGRARLCRHPGSAACRVQGFILTAFAASPNRLREERYKLPLGTRHINAVLVPSEPAGPANSKREIYRVTWSRICKLALQHFEVTRGHKLAQNLVQPCAFRASGRHGRRATVQPLPRHRGCGPGQPRAVGSVPRPPACSVWRITISIKYFRKYAGARASDRTAGGQARLVGLEAHLVLLVSDRAADADPGLQVWSPS